MFLLNPTKEPVTRQMDGVNYNFNPGEVLEVSEDAGNFFLEPRGETLEIPFGATTWWGLVKVTGHDDLQEAAKKGLSNYQRLLLHRLANAEKALAEVGDNAMEVRLIKRDGRIDQWQEWLDWTDQALKTGEAVKFAEEFPVIPEIEPPKGVKVRKHGDAGSVNA